ncbi:hypothetical protein LCGC14_0879270 [marine sediment metagenome]|uniref:Uncharacterized protein n=1 Tax=marine sediment metagenome TaxID=412755 RepID=A0A0F9P7A6_9ZZZZ
MGKEQFLQEHGTLVNPLDYDKDASRVWATRQLNELPVVLVDNGPFTAAAIGYCEKEVVDFLDPDDPRSRVLYMVNVDDIALACDGGGAALVSWLKRAGTEFEGLETFN